MICKRVSKLKQYKLIFSRINEVKKAACGLDYHREQALRKWYICRRVRLYTLYFICISSLFMEMVNHGYWLSCDIPCFGECEDSTEHACTGTILIKCPSFRYRWCEELTASKSYLIWVAIMNEHNSLQCIQYCIYVFLKQRGQQWHFEMGFYN